MRKCMLEDFACWHHHQRSGGCRWFRVFSGLESSALRVSFWAGVCGSGGRAWRVFCGFVLFFCFLYIVKVVRVWLYGVWFDFVWSWWLLAFCPSVSGFSSFYFCFLCPFDGCSHLMKSLVLTVRHIYFLQWFPFWWALSFDEVDFWPRGVNLFLTVQLSFDEVDLLDPDACEFIFYSAALLLMASIFWTLRRANFIFAVQLSFWWRRSFGPWGVRIYFLQCSSVDEVDFVDPEARGCLFPLLWVSSFGEADFVDLEVQIYFLQWITFWHPDSGLFVSLRQIHWHFFVCAPKVVPSLLGSFQHQKFLKSVQVFTWLGIGQNGPHLASGILLLPCCGWRLCTPLQVAWPRSATVFPPSSESRVPTLEGPPIIGCPASTLSRCRSWILTLPIS